MSKFAIYNKKLSHGKVLNELYSKLFVFMEKFSRRSIDFVKHASDWAGPDVITKIPIFHFKGF